MNDPRNTTIGELIALLFDDLSTEYGDDGLAALAVATVINDLLVGQELKRFAATTG
jgi:hypothetical protein